MTYEDAIQYIESVQKFGSKLELVRITRLLEKLGNPHQKLQVIHVAGTNGKGSTCAMLSSILKEQGYLVGLYTSPHLERYNERIQMDGKHILDQEFIDLTEQIQQKCMEMVGDGEGHPTVFECLTAMALLFFYQRAVDFVVLEVGLGGRFDATNVISKPRVSVICPIGMDHMEYLGDTIEQIAFEKAGIIKENCPTVLNFQDERVYNVINDICQKRESDLFCVKRPQIQVFEQNREHTIFSIETDHFSYNDLEIRMLGDYQLQNSATALLAIEALRKQGVGISQEAVQRGLKNARWAGRLEIIRQNPLILLDGAHNFDGVQAFERAIKTYFTKERITLLVGVLEDKEYEKMLQVLLPLADQVVATEPNNPRALSADKLGNIASLYTDRIYTVKTIAEALKKALQITATDGIICCVGSLYLIGDIRAILSDVVV